jgi:hypothetical protein
MGLRGLKIAGMKAGTGMAACAYLALAERTNTVSQTDEARQWMLAESDD